MKKYTSFILSFAIIFSGYLQTTNFEARAADSEAPTNTISRSTSEWYKVIHPQDKKLWDYTHKLTYTGVDKKEHILEITYNGVGGKYDIYDGASTPSDVGKNALDLPGKDTNRTGIFYDMSAQYKLDGKEQTFSHTNDKAQYKILVLNPDESVKDYYIVRIFKLVQADKDDPLEYCLNSKQIYTTPQKAENAAYITGKSECYEVANGSDLGILGPYIKYVNENVLPQSLGRSSFGGSPKSIPKVCKDTMVDPISKDDFEVLDALAKEIGYEKSPWRDEEKDKELYAAFYKSLSDLEWSDQHIDYQTFLNEYQSSMDEISDIPIELNSQYGENFISRALDRFGLTAATVLGVTEGAKYGVPKIKTAGSAVGNAIKGKLAKNPRLAKWFKDPMPETVKNTRSFSKVKTSGGRWVTKMKVPPAASGGAGASDATVTATGGLWTATATTIAIVGLVAIAITQLGITAYKQKVSEDAIKSVFKLMAIQLYMQKHIEFHACMLNEEIEGGGFTHENLAAELETLNQVDNRVGEALKDYEDAMDGDGEGEDPCPESKWNSPRTWFRSSLCGLGLALHGGGRNLLSFAQKQLFVVLGMATKRDGY